MHDWTKAIEENSHYSRKHLRVFFIAHGESVKWVKVGSEESTLVAKHIIGVT